MEFVWYRSLAEMRADVSRGFLGFAWWVIEPLLYMGAFYVIFGLILQQRGENYIPFLLSGLVVWKWFSSSVQNAATSITRNMGLIYQVYLPKEVFPAVAVVTSTLRFAFVFAILLIFLVANGANVTSAWFIDLPALLLLQFVLMLGVATVTASVVPFVPDVKFIIDNGLLLVFFLSGIFFRFDAIPDSLRPYFDLNPVAAIIHAYRQILISGGHPDWHALGSVMLMSLGFLIVGTMLLRHWDRDYAKKAVL